MFIRSARGAAYRKEKRYRIWTVVIIFFFILILIKLCITTLLFYSYAIWNLHFFTGLGPCLPNNLSTYGARRFHRSRSEWDRVFSRLTVVPGLSWFPIDEQEGKWNSWILPPATSPTATLRPPAASGKQASPLVGGRGHFHREGFNPATGSPTATLLRLHPSRRPHRGMRQ